jgi:porin
MSVRKCFGGLYAMAAMACAVQVEASQSEVERFQNRMSGDWRGARSSLSANGIDLTLGYVGEWLHNPSGGKRSASAYADQTMFAADMNLDQLFGWRGGSVHVLITNRNGPQLDAEAGLGTLLETHEIYGRGHYTRLTRFYLTQTLFDDRLTLKAGRGDVDFFPLSCDFINISFCGALPGYHSKGWYTWPIGQYFANVTFRSDERSYWKLGVLEVNARNLSGDQGLRLSTPDDDNEGTLTNFEVGWLPEYGSGNALPGAYRVGYWRNSSDYPDVLLNQQGVPLATGGGSALSREDSEGYYAMLQQQLTQGAGGGRLIVFANLSYAQRDVNEVDRLLSIGLSYTGAFTSRPLDRLGLVAGQNRVSARSREADRLSNLVNGIEGAPRSSEKPSEVNYSIAMARGCWLMPSLQYVRDLGGRESDDAWLVGLKLSAEF